jgi:hypothetical protein
MSDNMIRIFAHLALINFILGAVGCGIGLTGLMLGTTFNWGSWPVVIFTAGGACVFGGWLVAFAMTSSSDED